MVSIYHNILWSKYKGEVFSSLFDLSRSCGFDINFFQIAETEGDRVGLGGIDMNYHRYPFQLLFSGSYDSIPKFKLFFKLFQSVINNPDDVILLPGYHKPEYFLMLLACKIKNKKIGVFCDSTKYDRPRSYLKGVFKRLFFSYCDIYFGYGERSREYLLMYGAQSNKIFSRCQAAALPKDYDSRTIPALRKKMVSSNPRFLFVGRLSPEKNLKNLISSFSKVLEKNPSAELILVGAGPQKEDLINFLNLNNLTDFNVKFVGSKNVIELREEYLKATALILPSTSEPWGLVVNEALSYGCPVLVSSYCGCVPELVKEGVTGYCFDPFDINKMVDCMVNIIEHPYGVEDVSVRCLDLIRQYSPENAAQQIFDGCKNSIKAQI